jgi:hypothetical protein
MAEVFPRVKQHARLPISGGTVYRAALRLANKLCISEVHRRVSGDTNFPDYCRRWPAPRPLRME